MSRRRKQPDLRVVPLHPNPWQEGHEARMRESLEEALKRGEHVFLLTIFRTDHGTGVIRSWCSRINARTVALEVGGALLKAAMDWCNPEDDDLDEDDDAS